MNLPPLPDPPWLSTREHLSMQLKVYTADKIREYGGLCRKQALEEAASKSEAYSYMSQNFIALAEELRGTVSPPPHPAAQAIISAFV